MLLGFLAKILHKNELHFTRVKLGCFEAISFRTIHYVAKGIHFIRCFTHERDGHFEYFFCRVKNTNAAAMYFLGMTRPTHSTIETSKSSIKIQQNVQEKCHEISLNSLL